MAQTDNSPEEFSYRTRAFEEALLLELPTLIGEVRKQYDGQIQERARDRALELGLIGKFIGDKRHAPENISVLVIILSFSVMAILLFNFGPAFDKVATSLMSLVTAALGYLIGRRSSR
jgi:hypothetical protein